MRTKAKSWIGAALTALLAAGCFAGCGKDAALEPANGTDEAQPAEAVIEKEPVQEAERTFRTGLTITNNGMFDGERPNPEFDTL
jgi:PBP1b-binding outer membrane lipoprotein LpoB